jgi:hypothetical protein
MSAESWDWSLRVFDHVDVHASDYAESVRFYETVLAPLGIPKLVARDDWTCFTTLNVVNKQPATRNLHLCFYAREKAHWTRFTRPVSKRATARMAGRVTEITTGPATTRLTARPGRQQCRGALPRRG